MNADDPTAIARSIAEAAAGLIGTPFRLHGRNAASGLDCIGLVAATLESIGITTHPPRGYRLRNVDIERWLIAAEASGLEPTNDPIHAGDIVLVTPGPAQHHLLICESSGCFIHAHAGIGKVSRLPAPLPWPILQRWRIKRQP